MATDRHQAPSYPLRMPEDLKTQVLAAAEKNGRSLHAELLNRLQNSFVVTLDADAERVANERAYELAHAKVMIGILANLCSANGELLGILANAVESPAGVPEGLLESARKQAARVQAIPDALGYDPVKEMAEVRRLSPLVGAQHDDLTTQPKP